MTEDPCNHFISKTAFENYTVTPVITPTLIPQQFGHYIEGEGEEGNV